jgi:hypothetical protein
MSSEGGAQITHAIGQRDGGSYCIILYNYYSYVRAMTLVIMSHRVGEGEEGCFTWYIVPTVLTSSSILQVYEYKNITFLLENMFNFSTSTN